VWPAGNDKKITVISVDSANMGTCVLLAEGKPGSHHKSQSKSQSYDNVNVHSANESSLKAIEVGGYFVFS